MSRGLCVLEAGQEGLKRRPPCPAPHPPLGACAPRRNGFILAELSLRLVHTTGADHRHTFPVQSAGAAILPAMAAVQRKSLTRAGEKCLQCTSTPVGRPGSRNLVCHGWVGRKKLHFLLDNRVGLVILKVLPLFCSGSAVRLAFPQAQKVRWPDL